MRDERGLALSSLSSPWLQALMFGQVGVQPGMHVLEIGGGGYNAAREIVGDDGQVVTVRRAPLVLRAVRGSLEHVLEQAPHISEQTVLRRHRGCPNLATLLHAEPPGRIRHDRSSG
jgi:Protein-L-isoaspartate(D-aspartate) O-methyltransferase (PCMT)